MARTCAVTGRGTMVGHNVSHSNRKTNRTFEVNVRYKRFWLATEKRYIRLRVSSKGMRTIDKVGIETVVARLRAAGEIN